MKIGIARRRSKSSNVPFVCWYLGEIDGFLSLVRFFWCEIFFLCSAIEVFSDRIAMFGPSSAFTILINFGPVQWHYQP